MYNKGTEKQQVQTLIPEESPMKPTDQLYHLLKGKDVLFVGIGVSNRELIAMMADAGLSVTACDKRSAHQLGPINTSLPLSR